MIKLSNLADYAVELMCFIALKPDDVHSAAEISDLSKIPSPTVSKILGTMVRGELLCSHRGLNGGFSLARPAEEISIAHIIEAVDGPVHLTNCLDEESMHCERLANCGTRSQWTRINQAVKRALGSVLLSDMVDTVPDFLGDGGAEDLSFGSKNIN